MDSMSFLKQIADVRNKGSSNGQKSGSVMGEGLFRNMMAGAMTKSQSAVNPVERSEQTSAKQMGMMLSGNGAARVKSTASDIREPRADVNTDKGGAIGETKQSAAPPFTETGPKAQDMSGTANETIAANLEAAGVLTGLTGLRPSVIAEMFTQNSETAVNGSGESADESGKTGLLLNFGIAGGEEPAGKTGETVIDAGKIAMGTLSEKSAAMSAVLAGATGAGTAESGIADSGAKGSGQMTAGLMSADAAGAGVTVTEVTGTGVVGTGTAGTGVSVAGVGGTEVTAAGVAGTGTVGTEDAVTGVGGAGFMSAGIGGAGTVGDGTTEAGTAWRETTGIALTGTEIQTGQNSGKTGAGGMIAEEASATVGKPTQSNEGRNAARTDQSGQGIRVAGETATESQDLKAETVSTMSAKTESPAEINGLRVQDLQNAEERSQPIHETSQNLQQIAAVKTAETGNSGVMEKADIARLDAYSQIGEKIIADLAGKGSKFISMCLEPAELGKIDINMRSTQGKLIIGIAAENAKTQELLTGQVAKLVTMLGLSNLHVESVQISSHEGQTQSAFADHGQSFFMNLAQRGKHEGDGGDARSEGNAHGKRAGIAENPRIAVRGDTYRYSGRLDITA